MTGEVREGFGYRFVARKSGLEAMPAFASSPNPFESDSYLPGC